MLKKRLVPTPLLRRSDQPIVLAPPEKPGRFRFLRIYFLTLTLMWIWTVPRFRRRTDGRGHLRRAARRTLEILQELGGLWVKAGQLVAMRRDLFPDEVCEELAKLQDRAQGFPWEVARPILEENLGCPLEQLFLDFNPTPLAAASIGQVHVATLRHGGVRVAVKVQRPHVAETFHRDLGYIRFFVTLLKWFNVVPHARWEEGLWELNRTMLHELDYRREAASIRRMRRLLRPHKVYVPRTFSRYSTDRVLVMEFIEGVLMSEYIHTQKTDPAHLEAWLLENHVDPRRVGRHLYMTHARQVFEDNLFHCDLHPGNIVLLRDSRFALIDFGSVGSMEESMLKKYQLMVQAIAEGQFNKVTDLFLLIGPPLPLGSDLEGLRTDVTHVLRDWSMRTSIKRLPYHEKSLTQAMSEIARLFTKYRLPASWQFMQLNRAELTLDASLMFLVPQINYVKLARAYQEKARLRAIRRDLAPQNLVRRVGDLASVLSLTSSLAESVYLNGELLRKRALTFEASVGKAARTAHVFIGLLIRIAMLGGVVFVGNALYRRSHPERTAWPEWLSPVPDWFPAYTPVIGLGLMVLGVLIFQTLNTLQRDLKQKDLHPSNTLE